MRATIAVGFCVLALSSVNAVGPNNYFSQYFSLWRAFTAPALQPAPAELLTQRVFPAYVDVTRLRAQILQNPTPHQVELVYSGDRDILQRVAEIIFPVRLVPHSSVKLRVKELPTGQIAVGLEEAS